MADQRNLGYVRKMLRVNNIIYIDTCSLMNPAIDKLIRNYKHLFIMYDRKITITHDVYCELGRLLSPDSDECNKAMHAIEILHNNPDLFNIEHEIITEEALEKAFGDYDIHQLIFENRREAHQLLITNDHNLSADVFKYNSFRSVKGESVWVCYINYNGELQPCECVAEKVYAQAINGYLQEQKRKKDSDGKNETGDKNKSEKSVNANQEKHKQKTGWEKAMYGLAGVATGFCIGKFGKAAISALGSFISMV